VGAIFSMNLDGSDFTLLHSFSLGTADGSGPVGALTTDGTRLFGTTPNGGTGGDGVVFEMNLDGSGYTILQTFTGQPDDGDSPSGNVTLSADDSTLFGMTSRGGASNDGTIYSMTVPEPGSASLFGFGMLVLAAYRRRG
jgi:uncharacterized repeat protein (TIGR03803 family)